MEIKIHLSQHYAHADGTEQTKNCISTMYSRHAETKSAARWPLSR